MLALGSNHRHAHSRWMRSAFLRVALALVLAVGFFTEQSIASGGPAPSSAPALEMSVVIGAAAVPSNDPDGCCIPALGCADRPDCMCSTVLGQHGPHIEPPLHTGIDPRRSPSRRLADRATPPESPPPNVWS